MRPTAARRGLRTAWVSFAVGLSLGCTQRVVVAPHDLEAPDAAAPSDGSTGAGGRSAADAGLTEGPGDARADAPRIAMACQNVTDLVRLELPSVIVALERSSSMLRRMGDATRREIAYSAVEDMVRRHERTIAFGLEQFPAASGACLGAHAGCCAGFVKLAPQRGAGDKFAQALECDGRGSCPDADPWPPAAPVGEALRACRGYYEIAASRAPRYVLLLTDGDPECAAAGNACESAVTQASALAGDEGVRTMVVGIGDDARAASCLESIAEAGGSVRSSSPRFWLAERPDDVWASLRTIATAIASEPCRLRVPLPMPEGAAVQIGRAYLSRDPARADGWDYDGEQRDRLLLFGAGCAALKGTLERVSVQLCVREKF